MADKKEEVNRYESDYIVAAKAVNEIHLRCIDFQRATDNARKSMSNENWINASHSRPQQKRLLEERKG